jgi:hypothetical protein
VRSALVEVQLVLEDERREMEVVDQQHVVEQLSPCAADEALRDGVSDASSTSDGAAWEPLL